MGVYADKPAKTAVILSLLAQNNRWLAPMAGVADPVFRSLCIEQGAGLTYTEMISAKGLSYGNAHTDNLLQRAHNEDSAAVQLFGADPYVLSEQAKRIQDAWGEHLALLDINMGCPVHKVTKKGEGCALMKNPLLASRIIHDVSEVLLVPLTVKFRSGWSQEEITAVDFARMAESSGAAALCVHGRTATQLYSGHSNWDVLSQVKEAVTLPVIGSGDLLSIADCDKMMRETGVDGVMIARGARGNPWVFNGRKASAAERLRMALRHAHGLNELVGQAAIPRMRKHISWYLQSIPYATVYRNMAMRCATLEELDAVLIPLAEEFEREKDASFIDKASL